MAKIEVEHRGLLNEFKFKELMKHFLKRGKFLGKKKRFSVIYTSSEKSVREVKGDPIDLKLRIANGEGELALKYGKWSGKDARKEFNFDLRADQFEEMIEVLKILGYTKIVLMANTKMDYLYKGIEFSLVEVPDWGYYFEAEIIATEKTKDIAIAKIDKETEKLGLKILEEEPFYDLLDELNNRKGYRFDLTKTEFSVIKKQFLDYF